MDELARYQRIDALLDAVNDNINAAELAEMQFIGAQLEFTDMVKRILQEVERIHGIQPDEDTIIKNLSEVA